MAGPTAIEILPGADASRAAHHRARSDPEPMTEQQLLGQLRADAQAAPEVPALPNHLIVLCDGTWRSRRTVRTIISGGAITTEGSAFFTNVSLLSQALLPFSSQPNAHGLHERQLSLYQSGVGATEDLSSRIIEGATGQGLGLKVLEAYRFIIDNYLPGDSISSFGFSRGAYTARTLVAWLNWAGILSKSEAALGSDQLWEAYQDRDPSEPKTILAASKLFNQKTGRWPSRNAESTEVSLMRAAAALQGKTLSSEVEEWISGAAQRERDGRAVPPTIRVVGVWDSVGSLGVPGHFVSPDKVRFYSYFDPMLSPTVQHAFHAMALFEDREDFRVTRWYLPAPGTESAEDMALRNGQVLKQCWFQGSHSDVGGGKAWHGLSDISLAWMVAQINEAAGGPLIAVNFDILESLRDKRHAWAKQPQHPSRLGIEFQETRQILHQPDVGGPKAWSNCVDRTKVGEELHHSVVAGGYYSLESAQFSELRKRDFSQLDRLWKQAENPESLLANERRLKWGKAEEGAAPATPSHGVDDAQPDDAGVDPDLAPDRPGSFSKVAWSALKAVAGLPTRTLSFIVNLGPVPQDNLKPGVLAKTLQRIRLRAATRKDQKAAAATQP